VALLALARDSLASRHIRRGKHGPEIGQRFFGRRRGARAGRRDHTLDVIGFLRGLLHFKNGFSSKADDERKNQRAQNRARDLVPFIGIHKVRLR